ncbi:MAG TPA: hypothetical protein VF644_19210 [Pyrinomonadaceae bacterium]
MRKRVFSFIALFVLLFALNLFAQAQAIRDLKPTVILISLDCALLSSRTARLLKGKPLSSRFRTSTSIT